MGWPALADSPVTCQDIPCCEAPLVVLLLRFHFIIFCCAGSRTNIQVLADAFASADPTTPVQAQAGVLLHNDRTNTDVCYFNGGCTSGAEGTLVARHRLWGDGGWSAGWHAACLMRSEADVMCPTSPG